MTVNQLPSGVGEFADYLNGLMARLDQRGGWCRVFWRRDPEGLRACLDGREVPPWDVVESLLRDLGGQYGPGGVGPEAGRARALHTAALTAFDARPGGRDALGDRLGRMLREQRVAAERRAELDRLLSVASGPQRTEALRLDLAWARDDHERATARCTELRARLSRLDHAPDGPRAHGPRAHGTGSLGDDAGAAGGGKGAAAGGGKGVAAGGGEGAAAGGEGACPDAAGVGRTRPDGGRGAGAGPGAGGDAAPGPPPSPGKQRGRRRGGARFAGMAEEEAAPVVVPPDAGAPPTGAGGTGRRRGGARFAGAAEDGPAAPASSPAEPLDAADRRDIARIVTALARLRGEGRSGEAHALLVEVAHWPARRLPPLAAELRRTGLGADWATLLWEAASLPAERLVAAADALAAAGHTGDGERILRQGVARPAQEIGRAVLGLAGEGRRREIRALLDAYVRVRTPEEAARSAEPGPGTLVPLLLAAARGVSEERHWDLVHALRVAGFTA